MEAFNVEDRAHVTLRTKELSERVRRVRKHPAPTPPPVWAGAQRHVSCAAAASHPTKLCRSWRWRACCRCPAAPAWRP